MRTSTSNRPRRWARLAAATWAALVLVMIGVPAPGALAADETAATEQQVEASAEPAPEPADETTPSAQQEQPAEPAPKPEDDSSSDPDPGPARQDPAPQPEGTPAEPVVEAPGEPTGNQESQVEPAVNQDPQAEPVAVGATAALQDEALPQEESDDLPVHYPSLPRPAGQSDQPAPASRAKRVLENVHTDAVSAYLDGGKLVAQTKADIDVDGDGAIDLGTRLTTSEVLFHVSDAAKLQVPDIPGYSFLGAPGDTVWMAPMVQDPRVIWPGFSTEDPNLRGKADFLQARLIGFDGPGKVEVFMAATDRVFSSSTDLPAWRIGIPQHTHLNWAFTQPGSYTFTFQLSGMVDGRQQSAQNDYTFVVGDLAGHRRQTAVSLQAGKTELGQGEPVLLTATVQPGAAAGVVQFRDLVSGTVLGHTPAAGGKAQFVAEALNPGTHRIVADFVPTWSTDYQASSSAAVELAVTGDVQQRPTHDDTQPVSDSVLDAHRAGSVVEVTNAERRAVTGTAVTARVKDAGLAGSWLSVWLPGQSPAWRGWVQADQDGAFSVGLADARVSSQRLVVKDAAGGFVGWDRLEVVAPPAPGGDQPGGDKPGGDKPGDGPRPDDEPKAPSTQTCRPGVTLDRGHIDAFYVSAASGKAVLQLMEDVTGHHVIREAETVLLRVKESALGTVRGAPKGTPSKGYVLPLTQRSDLIWPGWDTNRTSSSGYSDVAITVTRVQGPGTVSLYTQGDWGAWKPILTSKSYKLPGTIREPRPAHTHAQWVFSKKGVYRLTAHAVATDPDTGRSLKTASHTYVFQVGDVPLGDVFCGLKTKGTSDAKQVNAAVNKAAAAALEEARAAEQADAEAAQETPVTAGPTSGPRTPQAAPSADAGSGGSLPGGSAGGGDDQALVAGLVGLGSGLLIAGIAGGAVWYVRRLRQVGSVVDAPA